MKLSERLAARLADVDMHDKFRGLIAEVAALEDNWAMVEGVEPEWTRLEHWMPGEWILVVRKDGKWKHYHGSTPAEALRAARGEGESDR